MSIIEFVGTTAVPKFDHGWGRFLRPDGAGFTLTPHVREREILKFIHRRSSLNILARNLARFVPGHAVKVESVWVDGTPQAAFTDIMGGSANCELADLLLLVRREQPNGALVNERGLLLQTKITPRHNRLTGGSSTKLERRLLERVDRGIPIKLYRDTQLASLLGTFTLGPTAAGIVFGLNDCSRFLLAPKYAKWLAMVPSHAPYQVGWPLTFAGPFLKKPIGFVQAILDIGVIGRLGRMVGVPGSDDWSNLIAAVRGAYVGQIMPGYEHSRIHVGSSFLTSSFSVFRDAASLLQPPSIERKRQSSAVLSATPR